ncbi:MAG TPA: alpha-L-fucosidase [Anaerolineae bacterium]|nr:alpha-L-fucosidase [Anaerolineae bacterium]
MTHKSSNLFQHMYEPTFSSVKQHPLPAWYHDAKFGIFIHWGLYSVPAFAPRKPMDLKALLSGDFGSSPYAEWYQNSLRIPGSAVQRYHAEKYGANFPYEDFATAFNEQSRHWDPEAWADLFQSSGARYVVLVTKHHDGFLMWPSQQRNPQRLAYHAARDIVGELQHSVTARGLKMGYYYSSALDWTFTLQPIQSMADLMISGPADRAYRDYVERHWKELIDRYEAWLLWSDIAYPPGYSLAELFAHFYNRRAEGVINDRWFQTPIGLRNPLGKFLINLAAQWMARQGKTNTPKVPHCDYVTTEYFGQAQATTFKWEACRGIGNSFGYNQFETADDYQTAPELIRLLADIVSKNGNLLLNVGPRADGTLPEAQLAALKGMGQWLAVNGAAIYGTRPWTRFKDNGERGTEVRYTRQDGTLYALVMTLPTDRTLALPDLPIKLDSQVQLLGHDQPIEWANTGGRFVAHLPPQLSTNDIPVLKLELSVSTGDSRER